MINRVNSLSLRKWQINYFRCQKNWIQVQKSGNKMRLIKDDIMSHGIHSGVGQDMELLTLSKTFS